MRSSGTSATPCSMPSAGEPGRALAGRRRGPCPRRPGRRRTRPWRTRSCPLRPGRSPRRSRQRGRRGRCRAAPGRGAVHAPRAPWGRAGERAAGGYISSSRLASISSMIPLQPGLGGRHGRDHPAVAHHRHAVGDLKHLVEAMGDVDDADPVPSQRPQPGEQLVALGRGERRGRLVEDEHAHVLAEAARDQDELGRGQPKRAGAGARVDLLRVDQRRAPPLPRGTAPRGRPCAARRRQPPRVGGLARSMLLATSSSGTSVSSWWMVVMP